MELKITSLTAIFFLFLLLVGPCSSSGKMDSGIYDIDYRGPETHTYIPPPTGSRGRHNFQHQSMLQHRKFKGLRASKTREKQSRRGVSLRYTWRKCCPESAESRGEFN